MQIANSYKNFKGIGFYRNGHWAGKAKKKYTCGSGNGAKKIRVGR